MPAQFFTDRRKTGEKGPLPGKVQAGSMRDAPGIRLWRFMRGKMPEAGEGKTGRFKAPSMPAVCLYVF